MTCFLPSKRYGKQLQTVHSEEQKIKVKSHQKGLEYLVKNRDIGKQEVFNEVNEFMQELIKDTDQNV